MAHSSLRELNRSEKLALYAEDPHHVKPVEEVIKPNIAKQLALELRMNRAADEITFEFAARNSVSGPEDRKAASGTDKRPIPSFHRQSRPPPEARRMTAPAASSRYRRSRLHSSTPGTARHTYKFPCLGAFMFNQKHLHFQPALHAGRIPSSNTPSMERPAPFHSPADCQRSACLETSPDRRAPSTSMISPRPTHATAEILPLRLCPGRIRSGSSQNAHSEELARTVETRVDLVQDEQQLLAIADPPQHNQKIPRRHDRLRGLESVQRGWSRSLAV